MCQAQVQLKLDEVKPYFIGRVGGWVVGDLENNANLNLISTQVVVEVEIGWGLDFTKLILNLTQIEDVGEV